MAGNRTIRYAKLMVGLLDVGTHLLDDTKHRLINDSGTSTTELFSASKIISELNDIDGDSQINDDSIPPAKLDATGVPGAAQDNYVPTYNHATGEFDWEDMEGVVGQDTYTVKWNTGDAAEFLDQKLPEGSTGSGNELLRVNAGGTAYELGPTLPTPVVGDATELVKVNAAGNGFDFATKLEIPSGAGDVGKSVVVNSAGDGFDLCQFLPNSNYLINPNCVVNQEDYVNGTDMTSVGDYAFDMWVAFASGANTGISSSGETITLESAAKFEQINDELIALTAAGKTCTISVESGTVKVAGGGIGIATAINATTSKTFTIAVTSTDGIRIEYDATDSGAFTGIKLEVGLIPTPYQIPIITLEELKCYKYFWRVSNPLVSMAPIASASTNVSTEITFIISTPVEMRTTPVSLPASLTLFLYGGGVSKTVTFYSVGGSSAMGVYLTLTATGLTLYETYSAIVNGDFYLDARY